MKRLFGLLLVVLLLLTALGVIAEDVESMLMLPAELTKIGEEAFANDESITRVMIPKTITEIGDNAFADCPNLKEIYIGKSTTLKIGKDAFKGCEDADFFVYAGTPAETYILANGFKCTLMEPDSDALARAMQLVADHGGASFLQSGTFATKRLIVRRKENRLPNISEYNLTSILQKKSNIYILQFETMEDTEACYTQLVNDANTVFVEADQWVDPLDTDTTRSIVNAEIWKTDDPMGFEKYAAYVKKNGKGTITIAVVDSGISIKDSYKAILREDGINVLAALDGESWTADSARHGSIIASVIKDCVDKSLGKNTSVKILPVRVVGADGKADCELIAEGIDYAIEKGAKIINLSMNFPESAIVEFSIKQAVKAGVTVVVAAGNGGRNISGIFPANMSDVITVSGIGPDYKLYRSNYGNGVDFCAPAQYINTAAFSGNQEGTSFAAPMIASAYALVSLDTKHTVDDMKAHCKMGEQDGSLSVSSAYGYGMPLLNELAKIDAVRITLNDDIPEIMKTGESTAITWEIDPPDADNQNVIVTSSDTEVLEITKKEDVTYVNAAAPGTATVTATISETSITAQVTITVVQPVTSIDIVGAQQTLIIGKTLQLTASVEPQNASNSNVRWVSTDTSVATVSETGLVTPVAAGTVGIYAAAMDGYGVKSETVTIEVIDIPPAESVTITIDSEEMNDKTLTLAPQDTAQLIATVLPAEADQTVTYDVYPEGVVTVSENGLITAVNAGTTVVTATASTGNNVRARLTVQVIILPTSVTISTPAKTTLDVGETLTLTAVVSPSNATDKTVTWTSSNSGVASVNSGLVTAIAPGSTNIIVTTNSAGKTASVTISVRQPYTLLLNANGGTCNQDSKIAYSGYAIGDLPTPTRNGCEFKGWYTAANGGTQVTASTTYTSSSTVTIYAHWESSNWVLESAVPSGAKIIATSWSYRESTESSSSSMSGWVANGNYWKQTGTGSGEYANFKSGEYNTAGYSKYATVDKYYSSMMHAPYSASESETNKREVKNEHAGWIYWHWAYNAKYSASANRIIAYKPGVYGSDKFVYGYWYSIKAPIECPVSKSSYNTIGQYPQNGRTTYDCTKLINDTNYVPASHKTASGTIGLCTWRFYRLEYFTSTYTDYQKWYKYYRDINYSTTDPGNGSNISNKVKYVKWSNNQ